MTASLMHPALLATRLHVLLQTAGAPAEATQGPHPGQDTLTGQFLDSVVVQSPLPDPLVPIVQWFFQKPSWVMISGIVIGATLGIAALVFLWRRRRSIRPSRS